MCAVADATFLRGHSSCIILDFILDFILDCFASAETLSGTTFNRSTADDDWSRGGNSVGKIVGNCWDHGP